MAPSKRVHKTLTLAEKSKILDCLDEGKSTRQIAKKFLVPKSTVFDIKKNKHKIRTFISKSFQGTGRNTNKYKYYLTNLLYSVYLCRQKKSY